MYLRPEGRSFTAQFGNDATFYQRMWSTINDTGYWQGEVWNRRKNGVIYAEWLTISTVRGPDGRVSHYVGAFSDITKDKEAQAEIHRLANYDPLTHLPNRRLLIDQIEQVLVSGTTRSHEAGDELLHEAARRLKARLRQEDVVATLGGDKFVVLLRAVGAETEEAAARAGAVAESLKQALGEPFCLDSGDFHCSVSVGTKLFGRGDETVDGVLRHAEVALYQAKAAGRNTLRFFDPEVQSRLDRKVNMESDLHIALEREQFRVYYQPQCDDRGHVVGAEALLRWDHPQQGLISPNDFIPLAEETGLIRPIGQWILETVCKQLLAWTAISELAEIPVAVNVSARQFRHPDFVDSVRQTLQKTGASPDQLKLELTESVVVHDLQDTYEKMQALKAIGITLSLDDFGTGNSSLSYLTRLPLDQLKIDRSFVCHLPDNENDTIICQTIIAMARGLGLSVIAEGVETDAQRELLAGQGCHVYQGYLFNRPLPTAVFEEFVAIASIA